MRFHMRHTFSIVIFLGLFLVCHTLPARADGEDKVEPGTQWVDPVTFYELQDVTTANLKRDYDQGDIDVNKVMKNKGVKIYGLKLKPVAIAAHIPGEQEIGQSIDYTITKSYEYQDIMGIKGIALNEANFCVYSDESVSRTYSGEYNINGHTHYVTHSDILTDDDFVDRANVNITISSLQIVPTDDGVGFSYALKANVRTKGVSYNGGHEKDEYKGNGWVCSKPAGVNASLGHFIYFKGSRHLMVILGEDLMDVFNQYKTDIYSSSSVPPTSHQLEMLNRPWARVYFEVTEMLVSETKGLSEEERKALIKQGDGLMAWLKGEGNPLGLGEHTGPMTSAVINMLSTIASILIGNSIVTLAGGGAGGSLASMLQTAGGQQPPTPPDAPRMDAPDPKKKDDDDEEGNGGTPPDPNKFTPTNYPDLCNQYLTQQPDGDIVVKSPVTGKDQHYYNQGDGTWISDSGIAYDKEDIENRLRYEAENAGTLKQDYDQADRNLAEQHAQWEKESKQLSKDGENYLKWKHAQEEAERKQAKLNKLGLKYHVADPTEENITKAIEEEKQRAKDQLLWAMKRDVKLSAIITGLEVVDKGAETFVYAAGNALGPGMGAKIRDLYTMGKAVGVAGMEAVIDKDKGFDHVFRGAVKGGVGILQHHAGGLVKDLPVGDTWKTLAQGSIWVGSNSITGALNGYEKAGSDIYDVGEGAQKGLQQKGAAWVISKVASGGYNYASDMEAKHNFLGVAIPKEIQTDSGVFNVGKATGTVAAKTIMAIPDLWNSAKEISNAASNYEIAKNL